MDKSPKDPFFLLPSGPQQILWANALRHLINNSNSAIQPEQCSMLSEHPSSTIFPPFLLPPSPPHHFASPPIAHQGSTSPFCLHYSLPSSHNVHPSSSVSKEAEIFEFATSVKKRRLHLGITQVSPRQKYLVWPISYGTASFHNSLLFFRSKLLSHREGSATLLTPSTSKQSRKPPCPGQTKLKPNISPSDLRR